MRHTVPTEAVMAHVEADGILDSYLSELLGLERSSVLKIRTRPTMPFSTADRILVAVNAEHCWYTDPALSAHYAPPPPAPRKRPKASQTRAERLRLAEELDVFVEEAA